MLNFNVNLIILIIASLSDVNCSLSNPDEQFTLRDHSAHHRIKRENKKNVSCVVPAKSADRVFEVYDADDELIKNVQEGSRVPKSSYIKFRCSEGYLLPDGGNEYTTNCYARGEWNPTLKPCLRICPALKISNVDLICTNTYKGVIECNGPLPIGSLVTARCKDHYHWIPESNRAYEYEHIQCRDNGQWNKQLQSCIPDCGIPKQELLVADGLEAQFGDFPWHIALYYLPHPQGPLLICGGTLITTNMVLTAAHCFYYERKGIMRKDPKDYTIVVAKMTRNYSNSDNPMQQEYKVSEIIFYEREYNPINGYSYDIAVLILKENVAVSSYVLPACSPGPGQRGFNPKINKQGILAGFGRDEKNELPESLKFARLNFTDSKECLKKISGGGLPPDKFCAGEKKGIYLPEILGPKPLKGDSGGGYIFKEGSLYYVRGIVSTKIDSNDGPIITFTDVAYYQDWIDTVIQQYSEHNTMPSNIKSVSTTTAALTTTALTTTSRPAYSPRFTKKKVCPKLRSRNVDLTCSDEQKKIVDCNRPLQSGTQVTARCKPFHHPAISGSDFHRNDSVRCQDDGKWDKELFQCAADCGVVPSTSEQTLIFDGTPAVYGDSPWHVAIYRISINYTLIAGGTLISSNMVVSAAHCFFDESIGAAVNSTSDYEIVVSKYTRDYKKVDNGFQKKYDIREIIFTDIGFNPTLTGQYGHDIVVLVLKKSVDINKYVLPACVEWSSSTRFEPAEGTPGKFLGWGVDKVANVGTSSLLSTELPFISYHKCVGKLRHITPDKFCAGSDTGPGARKGDSGGGLMFRDPNNGRYFLRGILSTSDRDNRRNIATFTDISQHLDWLYKIRYQVEPEN